MKDGEHRYTQLDYEEMNGLTENLSRALAKAKLPHTEENSYLFNQWNILNAFLYNGEIVYPEE